MNVSIFNGKTEDITSLFNGLDKRGLLGSPVFWNRNGTFDSKKSDYIDDLGSCISLVLYNPRTQDRILSHVFTVRPHAYARSNAESPRFVYAQKAVSHSLIRYAQTYGEPTNLESYLIGGVAAHDMTDDIVETLRGQLDEKDIPVNGEDIGGRSYRVVFPILRDNTIYVGKYVHETERISPFQKLRRLFTG